MYIPKRVTGHRPLRSKHPHVVRAREKLHEALAASAIADSQDNVTAVDKARKSFYNTNDHLMMQDLNDKITRVEQAHTAGHYTVKLGRLSVRLQNGIRH